MKKSEQNKIKVTPVNINTGAKAPYYIEDVNNASKIEEQKKQAIDSAREKSRLNYNHNFQFIAERI